MSCMLVDCVSVKLLPFSLPCRFVNDVCDVHVQEEAIALIACLATDVELVWHQSAVEGIHHVILKAMSNFPDEMFLAEISLEALGESHPCFCQPTMQFRDISGSFCGYWLIRAESIMPPYTVTIESVTKETAGAKEVMNDAVDLKLGTSMKVHSTRLLMERCLSSRPPN